jgi:hypothetical protein
VPTPKTSQKVLRETLDAYDKYGSESAAAEALGIKRSTFSSRRVMARKELSEPSDIVLPNLPSSELTAEEIMEHACRHFITHHTANSARRWMEIKVTTNNPIGVCFMGDPHIDNFGCNWPLLKRDIGILEKTKGMHAVNIGDLTDNWVGRLLRLCADQEMSKKEAWKLAKYLLRDCKISWLCHLLGNHDSWGDGAYLIKATAHPTVPVEDWQSRFQIVFPNDKRIRVHAAHDFPGSSIWNKMHGPQKASMLFEEADIYACGHKHEWGINTSENAQRDFVYHLIRARGYKFIDSYANNLGHASQKYGASITAIIDPKAEGPNTVTCFPDLEEAAEFLTWKRSK